MAARLTSSIFVSAVIRRVNGAGGFATVLRHGSDEAGAIFICVPGRDGRTSLYGQAPQSVFADQDTGTAGGRLFERLGGEMSAEELDERFAKEARLDPDFWIVELELSGQAIEDVVDIA